MFFSVADSLLVMPKMYQRWHHVSWHSVVWHCHYSCALIHAILVLAIELKAAQSGPGLQLHQFPCFVVIFSE